MKLIEISFRSQITKEQLSEEECNKILQTECSHAYKIRDHTQIYRGSHHPDWQPYTLVDSTSAPVDRKSANTANFYTSFLKDSPAWKNVARRHKSFICSAAKYYAETYGETYWLAPFNNAKVSYGDSSDFWTNFDEGGHKAFGINRLELDTLNHVLEQIFRTVQKHLKIEHNSETVFKLVEDARPFLRNLESLIKKLYSQDRTDISDKLKEGTQATQIFKAMCDWVTSKKSLEDLFEIVFDPKTNAIQTCLANDLSVSALDQDVEVWVEGKALILPINYKIKT